VSLSDNGDIVAIGAPKAETNHGYVNVYKFNSTMLLWEQLGNNITSKLLGGRAGSSISLSGDGKRLAVGIPRANNFDGIARIYQYRNVGGIALWVRIGQEIKGRNRELLGLSLSLSEKGERVAIGAAHTPGPGDIRGSVYIMNYDTKWKQIGKPLSGSDLFGRSVSLSANGNRVAIGSTGFDKNSTLNDNVGLCEVYEYSEDWRQLGRKLEGEIRDERSGYSVLLSRNGERLGCGGQGNSIVRVFRYSLTKWVQIGQEITDTSETKFGTALGMNYNGDFLAVGAPGEQENTGMVGVYEYSEMDFFQAKGNVTST